MLKQELKPEVNTKEPTVAEISQRIAVQTEELWRKSSIPITTHARILQLIRGYHDKYMKLMNPVKGRQNDKAHKSILSIFAKDGDNKLFDIASCKCIFKACHCAKPRKVPTDEQPFLTDQRTLRLMCISSVDIVATQKITKTIKRKEKEANRIAKFRKSTTEDEYNIHDMESDSQDDFDYEDNCDDSNFAGKLLDHQQHDNDLPISSTSTTPMLPPGLPTLARACNRHGVSDRCAAALASAVLQDFGVITPTDKSKVIDKNRIRRERKKSAHLQFCKQADDLCGLYFDDRKDKTLINTKEGSKHYRKTVVEEQLSLIQEPGSRYLGHVSPDNGSAKDYS